MLLATLGEDIRRFRVQRLAPWEAEKPLTRTSRPKGLSPKLFLQIIDDLDAIHARARMEQLGGACASGWQSTCVMSSWLELPPEL